MRRLDHMNPLVVTIYFLLVTGVSMFTMNPLLLLCSLLCAVLSFSVKCASGRLKMHAFSLALFAVIALVNPLVSHKGVTILLVINDNPVTLEAVYYGISAAMMILSVLYWFRIYTLLMTSDKLLYVFGSFSPKLGLMISMTLRYIPLFSRQAERITEAQKAVGLFKEDNIADTIKGKLRVFSVMVTWTLENGIITADSMTARGYGIGKRSRFRIFKWERSDVCFLAASLMLFTITVWMFAGNAAVYYPAFEMPRMTWELAAGYASYALLALLPLIGEGKEALEWKLQMSRI